MPNPVGPIATAISEGFKLLKTVLDTAEVRKMRKCIQVAENYIRVNQREGQFDDLTDEQQKKKLKYYSRKFFKLNN